MLLADFQEISPNWLPTTSTSISVEGPDAIDWLHRLQSHYTQLAESSNRSWPGLRSIRCYIFHAGPPYDPPRKSTSICNPLLPIYRILEMLNGDRVDLASPFNVSRYWQNKFHLWPLPPSITHVTFDLTMPREHVQFVEDCGPGGPYIPKGRKLAHYKFQNDYWLRSLTAMSNIIYFAAGYGQNDLWTAQEKGWLRGTEVTFEVIGTLPESQVHAVALGLAEGPLEPLHQIYPCLRQCLRDAVLARDAIIEQKRQNRRTTRNGTQAVTHNTTTTKSEEEDNAGETENESKKRKMKA